MNNKTALMLSLGHNSSAVYFDGHSAIGYEEERLNRVKSSSAYPALAIAEIEKNATITPGSKVYVSHWFNDFNFHQTTTKYFDKEHFWNLVEKYNLEPTFLSEDFTHHDAHAWSALSWVRDKINDSQMSAVYGEKLHIIAADGFGNDYETISIYEINGSELMNGSPSLVMRHKGYNESMGLMYQYAVDAVGMKMNQDEYKFLGYESHIKSVVSEKDYQNIVATARLIAVEKLRNIINAQELTQREFAPIADVPALTETRLFWKDTCEKLLASIDSGSTDTDKKKRIIIGHLVQTVIEEVMTGLVAEFDMRNVAVAGGIFYNVKLNNAILKTIPGLFSIIPLAGDQGCGPGMYEAFQGSFRFGNLKWGKRPSLAGYLDCLTAKEFDELGPYISYYKSQDEVPIEELASLISSDEIVNVVRGSMEFGPRALCATTTFALPTRSNVADINTMNNRDTVMPMAPVMSVLEADRYFDRSARERVIGSDKFMILTYDYNNFNNDDDTLAGVCHQYPTRELYSGRPQLIDNHDTWTLALLDNLTTDHKVLINTSFNAHGRPIVFDVESVIDSFRFEFYRAKENGLKLPYLCLIDGEV